MRVPPGSLSDRQAKESEAGEGIPRAWSRSTSSATLLWASSREAAGMTASSEKRHSFSGERTAVSGASALARGDRMPVRWCSCAGVPGWACGGSGAARGGGLVEWRRAAWSVGERLASRREAAGSIKREKVRGSRRAAACREEAVASKKSSVAGAVRSCGTRTSLPGEVGRSGDSPDACSSEGCEVRPENNTAVDGAEEGVPGRWRGAS